MPQISADFIKKQMCFLNISTSLHTRLGTETHPADGKLVVIIIIIIIMAIIIIINCSWVVTRWQWLFYMYTKYEIGY